MLIPDFVNRSCSKVSGFVLLSCVMLFNIEFSYYFAAAIGAFVLLAKQTASGQKTVKFIPYEAENPNVDNILTIVEALIFCVTGALLGVLITQPNTYPQAVVAGLGWIGLTNATSSKS